MILIVVPDKPAGSGATAQTMAIEGGGFDESAYGNTRRQPQKMN